LIYLYICLAVMTRPFDPFSPP